MLANYKIKDKNVYMERLRQYPNLWDLCELKMEKARDLRTLKAPCLFETTDGFLKGVVLEPKTDENGSFFIVYGPKGTGGIMEVRINHQILSARYAVSKHQREGVPFYLLGKDELIPEDFFYIDRLSGITRVTENGFSLHEDPTLLFNEMCRTKLVYPLPDWMYPTLSMAS